MVTGNLAPLTLSGNIRGASGGGGGGTSIAEGAAFPTSPAPSAGDLFILLGDITGFTRGFYRYNGTAWALVSPDSAGISQVAIGPNMGLVGSGTTDTPLSLRDGSMENHFLVWDNTNNVWMLAVYNDLPPAPENAGRYELVVDDSGTATWQMDNNPQPAALFANPSLAVAPTPGANSGARNYSIRLTPSWTLADGAAVTAAVVRGPGIATELSVISNGQPMVRTISDVPLRLGNESWRLEISGTDTAGNADNASFTRTIQITNPPRQIPNLRIGFLQQTPSPTPSLTLAQLQGLTEASDPRPRRATAANGPNGVDVAAYVWIAVDSTISIDSVILSGLTIVANDMVTVADTANNTTYNAYRFGDANSVAFPNAMLTYEINYIS